MLYDLFYSGQWVTDDRLVAWQLPEHETHWLNGASLDPAKFEDGRFPAFVNENTVEPIPARADLPRND